MGKGNLNRPNIRQIKPGYREGYYDIFENLQGYAEKIFAKTDIEPKEISVMEGETSVILKVLDKDRYAIVKINPFPDDLFTSNYFYKKLEGRGVPTPKVLYFDDSRTTIPYDFQILEFVDGVDIRVLPVAMHIQAGVLIGEVLRKVHRVEVDGFGWPLPRGGWGADSWLDALGKNYFDSSLEKKKEIFSEKEISEIEELTFFNEKLNIVNPHLIHSDVGQGNGLYKLSGELSLAGFIDPGGIIGGDPIFDLAHATNEQDDFSQGIWDGYMEDNTLSSEEEYRYKHLQLLSLYWSTCWYYTTGKDFSSVKEKLSQLFTELEYR